MLGSPFIRLTSRSSGVTALGGKSDDFSRKPIVIVPSGAVLMGGAGVVEGGVLPGFLTLGGGGIAAIFALRGITGLAVDIDLGGARRGTGMTFGAALGTLAFLTTFGTLAFPTDLGTGGTDGRIDGTGGGGTLPSRGGLALGRAAIFFGGAGATVFGGVGAVNFGGVTALRRDGFLLAIGGFGSAGFAIAGGGTFWRAGFLDGMFAGGTPRGLAATFGAGRLGVERTGGRRRAVADLGGCNFWINSGGRLKVERGGVAGGGNSVEPGLGLGAARVVRSNPSRVGTGPSLSRALRSTMTLGRLEPGI